MDFLDLEKRRYAVRSYTNQAVEEEKLDKILEAARIAPTAANRQSQRIYVLREEDMEALQGAVRLHGAPMAILVCCDKHEAWVRGYDEMNAGVIDATIVTTMMMMEATQLGLGSLWVCAFDSVKVRAYMHLDEGIEPVNILCLGYMDTEGDPNRFDTTRKPLKETLIKR